MYTLKSITSDIFKTIYTITVDVNGIHAVINYFSHVHVF